jgi:hypothetical protein
LRESITREQDESAKGYIARELVRVGLPDNARFVRDLFFAANSEGTNLSDVRNSLFIALGQSPLTDAKRKLLFELILDPRCPRILIPSRRTIGNDMYRRNAIHSINAHAGCELVANEDQNELSIEEKSEKALDRILTNVKKLAADREEVK